jgi:hypothetical protein
MHAADTYSRERAHSAVLRRSQTFGGVVQAHHLRGILRALLARPSAPTQRVLAARSRVSERTISRILHGNDQTTRFDIADALLTALDATDLLDDLTAAEVVLDG